MLVDIKCRARTPPQEGFEGADRGLSGAGMGRQEPPKALRGLEALAALT